MRKLPLLIAEIGGNHQGDFEKAIYLVELALRSKVDIIKMQVYSGRNLVNKHVDENRFNHFSKFELTIEQHIEIAKKIKNSGKSYLASVWEEDSLIKLSDFMDYYKVGSGDLTNYLLLSKMCLNPKPLILSTGLSNIDEVYDVVNFLRSKCEFYRSEENLILLQCTSMYPISYSDANLNILKSYKELFGCKVGYSDHTIGTEALFVASILGAHVLEFHFTDNKHNKTFRDHAVSLELDDVFELTKKLSTAFELLGTDKKFPLNIEIENGHLVSFRRGVYLNRDVSENEVIHVDDIVCLRPNLGIDARDFNKIIGLKPRRTIRAFEQLSFDDFEIHKL